MARERCVMLPTKTTLEEVKRKYPQDQMVFFQPKLDGVRCVLRFDLKGKPSLWSSTNREITGVPHILEEIEKKVIAIGKAFDGELYNKALSLQEINAIASRTRTLTPDYKRLKLILFDSVRDKASQSERLRELKNFFQEPSIGLHKYIEPIANVYELLECAKFYFEDFVGKGFEGLIIRFEDCYYTYKRTTKMLKIKAEFKLSKGQVIGVNEAISIEGEPKNMVGSFEVRDLNSGLYYKVGAGSLDHHQRRQLFQAPPQFVTIKYRTLTDDGKPREAFVADTKGEENG